MSNTETRHRIQQIGIYLCNNVPFTDIETRKELLQSLGALAEKLGIDFVEYCQLLDSGYEVKEPIRN